LDKEMKNMGTTVVMAVWRKAGELFITGVGDSRAYLVRAKRISRLTVDHSLAQALVEAKTISAAEAKEHRFRNVLWKYLGSKEVGDGPDVKVVPIQPGDKFVLCTDGMSGPVPESQLLSFVAEHPDVQACADGLGQLALDNGSRDNVSVIVIEVVEGRGRCRPSRQGAESLSCGGLHDAKAPQHLIHRARVNYPQSLP